jgi:hypothetical protein
MSPGFEERLFPRLPQIIAHFGTPFHILTKGNGRIGGEPEGTLCSGTGFPGILCR